jgi:hypothetical protein
MPGERKYTTTLKIRLTEWEDICWRAKAQEAGISLSEYIRSCANRRQIPAKIPEVNRRTYGELGKIQVQLREAIAILKRQQQSEKLPAEIERIVGLIQEIQRSLLGLDSAG